MTTLKAIARTTQCDILGKDALEEAEVQQWMEYCLTKINASQNDKSEMKEIIKVRITFFKIHTGMFFCSPRFISFVLCSL